MEDGLEANDSKEVIVVTQMRNGGLEQSIDGLDGKEWIWQIQEADS